MEITAKEIMLVDTSELAETIEFRYSAFLKPYQVGYYLPGSEEPAMTDGGYYTYKNETGQEFSVSTVPNIADIRSNIYNSDGEVVVDWRKIKQLTTVPHAPYRSIRLIRALIENCVDRKAGWLAYTAQGFNVPSLDDVVRSHLDEKYVEQSTPDDLVFLAEQINDLLLDVRTNVIGFVGNDKWIMHMVRIWRNDILVEKLEDFRIYDWERKHKKK